MSLRNLLFVWLSALIGLGAPAGASDTCGEWGPLDQPPPLGAVVFGNGWFVSSAGLNSEDGVAWWRLTEALGFNDAVWDGVRFVAVGRHGQFMLSDDGVTWDVGDTGIEEDLSAIAFDGHRHVAVGQNGRVVWSDDGVAWTASTIDPVADLQTVIWDGRRFLAGGGSGDDIGLFASPTGLAWSRLPLPPDPELFFIGDLASNGSVWVMLGGSEYGGGMQFVGGVDLDFARVQPSPCGSHIEWDGATFICVTNHSRVPADDGFWLGITTSRDATEWTEPRAFESERATDLAIADGRAVVTTMSGTVLTSVDGDVWNQQAVRPHRVDLIEWDGSRLLAAEAVAHSSFDWRAAILASPDGRRWTELAEGPPHQWGLWLRDLAASDNGVIVVVGETVTGGFVAALQPGGHLEETELPEVGSLRGAVWTGAGFVAVGAPGAVLSSVDGVGWSSEEVPTEADLADVWWAEHRVVAVGSDGMIVSRADGGPWSLVASPTTRDLNGVGWTNGLWVAVGDDGTILISDNGVDWNATPSGVGVDLVTLEVLHDGALVALGGDRGLVSRDGVDWIDADLPPDDRIDDLATCPRAEIAVGGDAVWRRRCPPLAPTSGTTAIALVPAVAHIPGRNDTTWRTDLAIHNPGDAPERFEIQLRDQWGHTTGPPLVSTLRPGRSARLSDMIGRYLGRDAVGSAIILSEQPLFAQSRTFNRTAGGTFGQGIASVDRGQLISGGDRAVLIQLEGSSAARTNIGVVSLSDAPVAAEIGLFAADGSLLKQQTEMLPPFAFRQLNDVFRDLGPVEDGFAVVHPRHPGGSVTAYASVVDAITGDATFHSPVVADEDELWIPVAAHVDGKNGTRWRTSLEVLNHSDVEVEVRIAALPAGRDNTAGGVQRTVLLPGGSARRFDDVVGTLFGANGIASLRLTPSGGPVSASSRTATFAAQGGGSYGQVIPAVPRSQMATPADTRILIGLAQRDSEPRPVRTNVGIVNVSDRSAEFELDFMHGDGTPIGSTTVYVPPLSLIQVFMPLADLADQPVDTAVALVRALNSGIDWYAYASVVDGVSGDPSYVGCRSESP